MAYRSFKNGGDLPARTWFARGSRAGIQAAAERRHCAYTQLGKHALTPTLLTAHSPAARMPPVGILMDPTRISRTTGRQELYGSVRGRQQAPGTAHKCVTPVGGGSMARRCSESPRLLGRTSVGISR